MTTAEKLRTLAQLHQRGQFTELMDRTLDKLFSYEADISRQQLAQLQSDLAEFEARYGMTSEEFYARFQAGELGDDMDYVEWASLVQMARNLRERLSVLTGEAPA